MSKEIKDDITQLQLALRRIHLVAGSKEKGGEMGLGMKSDAQIHKLKNQLTVGAHSYRRLALCVKERDCMYVCVRVCERASVYLGVHINNIDIDVCI